MHHQDLHMLFVDFSTSPPPTTSRIMTSFCKYCTIWGFLRLELIMLKVYTILPTPGYSPHMAQYTISIHRGTIQGDKLSPFLFLVFMEPLLRWLHSGGWGYTFGCLLEEDKLLHQCSSPAYADDLLRVTHTTQGLEVQANKIAALCELKQRCV
jgi:hypothetical protein